jgi:hypothetical protein
MVFLHLSHLLFNVLNLGGEKRKLLAYLNVSSCDRLHHDVSPSALRLYFEICQLHKNDHWKTPSFLSHTFT